MNQRQSALQKQLQDFYFVFQPIMKVEGQTHEIDSYEILLRFRERQLFPTDLFQSMLADETAALQMTEWFESRLLELLESHPPICFTLNVNLQQFLYRRTFQMLEKLQPYHQRLKIEFTEFYNVNSRDDYDLFQQIMTFLHQNGYRVVFDDVGSGQHSTSFVTKHLSQVDCCKLSLLDFKHLKPNTMQLYLDFWKQITLDYQTVMIIEGVETEAEAKRLAEQGFSLQQGYYWSRPLLEIPSSK